MNIITTAVWSIISFGAWSYKKLKYMQLGEIYYSGKQRVNSLFEMSNKTDVEIAQISTTNHGLKRKVEETYLDEVYIPSKRVSPFLNTPKERKDKRRKIINISTKKLKQLDDPETFLRRTVLVNNTMKRLQMELREEKLRTKEFKSNKQYYFSGYGVLNDKVMSNSYFVDDPFLSCVHEKITDDMTDTLMNNVFHDKVDDRPTSYDICEKSDIMSNKMETLEAESDHVSNNLLDRSEDSLEQCTCDRNGNIKESRKECYPSACSENRPNMKEMLVDRCVDLDEVNRISTNSFTENSNHICCDKCLSVIIPKSSNASNENTRILPREVQEMQCDQNVENDIKASPANFVELRT
ncbi:uncharacterized protein LOC128545917 isoform X2 [Mercenaria mercenaria]|uniref:uncharacterized protein LOC128545917 isoform X2 n=1 Tax=Mercenaria mercenaria TaxID=6596 RepID=UPI00234EFC80|nr:uncharacterized protein LOC128545917 isoform X2 [Mercenaria mercenaria]